jgi:chemotaxis family two-component system response regulator PixG
MANTGTVTKQKAIASLNLTRPGQINKTTDSRTPPTLAGPDKENRPLIICIDDCPLTQKLLKGIITKAGYRFFGIEQAVMALPILIEQKPDLILLDLVMPIANGYEICTQIRRVSLLKDTPVAILTGRDGLVDRVRAKIVGCSDFIAKPVETEKVVAVIEKYLGASKL